MRVEPATAVGVLSIIPKLLVHHVLGGLDGSSDLVHFELLGKSRYFSSGLRLSALLAVFEALWLPRLRLALLINLAHAPRLTCHTRAH